MKKTSILFSKVALALMCIVMFNPFSSKSQNGPVGGTVVYANSASSPMSNALVVLKQRVPFSTDFYRITPITYAPESFSGSNGPSGDDVVSGAIPIGFNFNFFGNVYSNLYIST
ncbi:MAG: hypothetical protein ACKO6M_03880, partial [Bacteroidota bacterium]